MLKKRKAFTLMEISVVVLIIAILAVICSHTMKDNSLKKKQFQYYAAYRTLEDVADTLLLKSTDIDYTQTTTYNNFLIPAAFANDVDVRCNSSLGYYNMKYDEASNTCICNNSAHSTCVNNDKACCPVGTSTRYYFVTGNSNHYIACNNDFNPNGEFCCPTNSYYDSGANACKCVEGYLPSGTGASMVCTFNTNSATSTYCPKGYVYSVNVANSNIAGGGGCVINTILSPSDFCKNIANKMNIDGGVNGQNVYCDGPFKACVAGSASKCYPEVFNAAKGNDGLYLSTNVKIGAFKNLKPNLIFANGIKLWIPQQKSASMPGLSMSPVDIADVEQNTCVVDVTKPSYSMCNSDDWCPSDGLCYKVSSNTKAKLTNASACCTSPQVKWDEMDKFNEDDYANMSQTDFESATNGGEILSNRGGDKNIAFAKSGFTVFVDIDGDDGSGTLWDDVFPFYICTDGLVYPGYALGGGSAPNLGSTGKQIPLPLLNAGNNQSVLPTDVYYYENINNKRKRIFVFSGIPYARAVCLAGKISPYAPYCLNLGFESKGVTDLKSLRNFSQSDVATRNANSLLIVQRLRSKDSKAYNPCASKICYVSVKRKMRMF